MSTPPQSSQIPLTGRAGVDALLASPLPWNAIGGNTIRYTFSLADQDPAAPRLFDPATLAAFNTVQQAQARAALAYTSQLTGIRFVEVGNGFEADFHFANAQLGDWFTQDWTRVTNPGGKPSVDVWMYFDSAAAENMSPTPGTLGYENLLHEIGIALGLGYPELAPVPLPAGNALGSDNTATTLMSGNPVGGPYATFSPYDVAALEWLYGGDGLGGSFGVGAAAPIVGDVGNNLLAGGAAADRLLGGPGDDVLQGNGGIDTAVYALARSQYSIGSNANGHTVQAIGGTEGRDTLTGIERLSFLDINVAFDGEGNAGMAYRLYRAAFDREPDLPGLGYHIASLDRGVNIVEVARQFIASPEFQGLYGNPGNEAFVRELYHNVLHREPDAPGLAYHIRNLETTHTRADVLVGFSESPENKAAVIGSISSGIVYEPLS